MESSWLLTNTIDIEQERLELEHSGLSWDTVEQTLISKYRESSKKRMFRCKCCNATTYMVLNRGKACHFKHKSAEECAGSRNYTRYTSATNTFESYKHRIGKSIIKDQLKSNLSLFGATITDGYLYREELNFVPDIIVEWPSGEVWSFDYVTGTGNPRYQRHLLKKQATYRMKNFNSYFFFDHGQIVQKQEQHALALNEAEKGSLQFLKENIVWQGLLEDLAEKFDETVLISDSTLKLKDMKVYQLLYVTDEFNGILYKISQLEIRQPLKNLTEIPDRWYMIVGNENSLSINELFSYHCDSNSFVWESLEVSNEELNEVVSLVDIRYQALLNEEKSRQEEQQVNFSPSQYEVELNNVKVNQPHTLEEKIKGLNMILEKMRNSTRLKSNPNFLDRVKECEEDILTYQKTGEQPSRLYTNVEMMKIALNI